MTTTDAEREQKLALIDDCIGVIELDEGEKEICDCIKSGCLEALRFQRDSLLADRATRARPMVTASEPSEADVRAAFRAFRSADYPYSPQAMRDVLAGYQRHPSDRVTWEAAAAACEDASLQCDHLEGARKAWMEVCCYLRDRFLAEAAALTTAPDASAGKIVTDEAIERALQWLLYPLGMEPWHEWVSPARATKARADMRAVLTDFVATAPDGQGWQPIATAPERGDMLIAWWRDDKQRWEVMIASRLHSMFFMASHWRQVEVGTPDGRESNLK